MKQFTKFEDLHWSEQLQEIYKVNAPKPPFSEETLIGECVWMWGDFIDKVKCHIFGHQWIEWEHSSDRPRNQFIKGMCILKSPLCARCNKRK